VLVQVSCLGLFSSGFGLVLPAAAQEATPGMKEVEVAQTSAEAEKAELPDSPSTTLSKSEAASVPRGLITDQPSLIAQSSAPTQSQDQSQSPQSQSGTSQPQAAPRKQEPVGTAAAEAPRTTGVAASQPAGLAIAPAKQRRVRTIILRTGAIIGAGVAVGSVIALTEATSSKPPGAH